MRAMLLAIFSALIVATSADEPAVAQRFGSTLNDPRQPVGLYTMIDAGEEPKTVRSISDSILIICWMPAPDGTFGTYQISGLGGYHTKDQVERFLTRFYAGIQATAAQSDRPNIVLAGNNWGAGLELKDTLRAISKSKSLAIFYVGGWAFSKVSLIPEPDSRKQLLERAYEEANK